MSGQLLPPRAHRIAAQIEDAMHVWNSRPAEPSGPTLDALRRAIDLSGDMMAEFGFWRDQLWEAYVAHGGKGERPT